MHKITFSLYVPSLMQTFDLRAPDTVPLHALMPLLQQCIEEESNAVYVGCEMGTLCLCDGTILNINMSLYDLGIRQGHTLMLI